LTAYAWVRIPPDALVVTQVDFDGTPTNAESKGFALLFGPILLICLAPLLDVVPFVPYGKKSVFYRDGYNLLVWYMLLVVMSVVQALIVVGAIRNT
jgi:hypothetical protein